VSTVLADVTFRPHEGFIIKTLSKGGFGGYVIFTNVESEAQHGSTKSGFAGTRRQQDFTPMASAKPLAHELCWFYLSHSNNLVLDQMPL